MSLDKDIESGKLLREPNAITTAAIAEGRAAAYDNSVKGYSNMENLKAELEAAQLQPRSPIGRTWEEVRAELFTPEEIAESNARVERIIADCVANQTMEGQICTEEDKAAMRRIVTGETTLDQELAPILAKYRKD